MSNFIFNLQFFFFRFLQISQIENIIIIIQLIFSFQNLQTKNYAMHIVILLIFLCNTLRYSNAFTKCCQENNILVNGSCWDGSNVTSLSCEVRKLMGPNQDPPRILEIDDDDSLLITDEEEVGYYKVDSDKYKLFH